VKKIIIAIIGVLIGLSLISNISSRIMASDMWMTNYGKYSETTQFSMLFWAFMFICVIIGVIYLWWKKAI
jgi:hypothetical protein